MANARENLFVFTPMNFKEDKLKSPEIKSVNVSEYTDKYDPLIFCRTCANIDPCLVPIFKKEGLDYNLSNKIEKYLPIRISEEDDLPLHLCYHCASLLIAWDTLVIGCVEAEKKLITLKDSLEDKQDQEVEEDQGLIDDDVDSDDEPLIAKKSIVKLKRAEEKRDILQEKNDLQTLQAVETETERLMEEPGLSFSIYQHHSTMRRPFIFEVLSLRIDNPFCCKLCTEVSNLKFSYLKSLKKLKSNSDVRNVPVDSFDDGVVSSEITIKNQKRRKRLKSKSHVVCEYCNKIFSCKLNLKNHIKTHIVAKNLTCHVCGKAFRHRFNLLRHLRVIHEGVRNHVCSDCGKRYRSHGEMEDHRNIHNVKKKIICEECGRIFLTKASFYPHKKTHRVKPVKKEVVKFDCERCHKEFTTKKSRNQHMLIHTGEKPIVCTICGKNFRTKANFSQHAKVHSDVKPFECEHCGKAFARKDHMRIHVRCHTGEKPFVCNYCGRGFAQMNDMKKHAKIHEKKMGVGV